MQGNTGGTREEMQPQTGLSVVHVRQETGHGKNFAILNFFRVKMGFHNTSYAYGFPTFISVIK